MRDLRGQVVVISGASSGIGAAIAEQLLEEGLTTHLLGRDLGRLHPHPDRQGERAVNRILVDLGDDVSLDACSRALRALPKVDILIHSAGVVTLGSVAEASLAELDLNYRINLRAPFALTQALLPKLIAARGQVVFVNSGAGLNARAGWTHYAASKHGLKALADGLREEVKPLGVRVTSIYPGRTHSPMQEHVRRLEKKAYDSRDFIQPQDVAAAVLSALRLPESAHVVDLNLRPPG